ncbi:MAG TPA: hypothetical protein VEQ10_09910 [Vicinamibacteria bacterium]|nr:hypothetical protein [Vicinamibacteria bacterium]
MSFEVKADGLDVQRLLADVYKRIAERKQGLYTDEELRYIAERPLLAVLTAQELRPELLLEFRARDSQWNFSFGREEIYRSSRGGLLPAVRRLLRPVQKLFWNPTPMISALSRQSDLNRFYVHLLHNLVLELSRLNLELTEEKSRNLHLLGRLEALERREKTLEQMVVYREEVQGGGSGRG